MKRLKEPESGQVDISIYTEGMKKLYMQMM